MQLSLFAAAVAAGAAFAQSGGDVLPPGLIARGNGTGAWSVIVAEAVPDLRTHTIYHPEAMGAGALPLVVWGNGGCYDNGLAYAVFLGEVASHGYFVVSLGFPRAPLPPDAGTRSPAARPAPNERRADATQAEQMIEAIEWATLHAADPSSPYYGHIDVEHIGVFGHSCGGLQAIQTAADPRVTTALFMNSGVVTAGPSAGPMSIRVTKEALGDFHGPVAYVTGGPSDIAHANAVDDVARIQHVPVFFAYDRSGHGGTYFSEQDGGDYAQIAADWFDWHLRGDADAAKTFVGEDCGLCTQRRWTVARQPPPFDSRVATTARRGTEPPRAYWRLYPLKE
jgi:dienelactone hydrolase